MKFSNTDSVKFQNGSLEFIVCLSLSFGFNILIFNEHNNLCNKTVEFNYLIAEKLFVKRKCKSNRSF